MCKQCAPGLSSGGEGPGDQAKLPQDCGSNFIPRSHALVSAEGLPTKDNKRKATALRHATSRLMLLSQHSLIPGPVADLEI